ncbi:hypothetical protein L6164_023589 [Bauhinia variegata]|uniref:Uncharacterized protein n=1 Tax=Bauhinia variegata TaxID=167791 RepID=A0ACB9MJ37_BAUVA|nr:hypothetical protein L6164_023589 [Bauhinia variegata]
MEGEEETEIIIVGAGICGLSTALALHRKGLKSLVLEKSESLRAVGGGITMRSNGWHALGQLCVASELTESSVPLRWFTNKWLDSSKHQETAFGVWEIRCLRRCDLINTLAESLPSGTIIFGCQVLSVELDPLTSLPILQLNNGSVLKAKVSCLESVELDDLHESIA